MSEPISKAQVNLDAYSTDLAIDKYSHYFLYENEKYLVNKYFQTDKAILDLACGAGRTTVRLHEMGYSIKGIDLSEMLINVAKKRFLGIQFEVGDYCNISEKDQSVDNILLSHNGLDYAYPEAERVKALKECSRVMKPGGFFIFSTHNIKSLYCSPYYFKHRKLWFLKNFRKAIHKKTFIYDLNMWTFYSSPAYCISQVQKEGFCLKEMVGFRSSKNPYFNKYISPYIHFVFQKK